MNLPPPKPPATRPGVPGASPPVLLHDARRPKALFAQLVARPMAGRTVLPGAAHPEPPRMEAGLRAHAPGHGSKEKEKEERRDDPLDPAVRQLAQLGPPPQQSAPATTVDAAIAPRARVSLEELLPQLVRRIAWAGDRRRGSVQLELGAGPHAGTVITVHADDGRVRVEVRGSEELRARIAAAGLPVED